MSKHPDRGLVPHLTIRDRAASKAIAFYAEAFNATELFRLPADDGERLLHAHLSINGDSLMLQDDFPEFRGGSAEVEVGGVILHLEVDDADAWWGRAIHAGATPIMELADQFWGARYGQVMDPFGHTWSIGSPLE